MRRPRISLSSATWLFLGAVYFVVPLVGTMLFSLQSGRNSSYSLSAYGTVVHDHTFWTTLRLSVELALETIAISLVLLVPIIIGQNIGGDVLSNPHLSQALAFGMIVVIAVSMILYALVQRRASRWMK